MSCCHSNKFETGLSLDAWRNGDTQLASGVKWRSFETTVSRCCWHTAVYSVTVLLAHCSIHCIPMIKYLTYDYTSMSPLHITIALCLFHMTIPVCLLHMTIALCLLHTTIPVSYIWKYPYVSLTYNYTSMSLTYDNSSMSPIHITIPLCLLPMTIAPCLPYI